MAVFIHMADEIVAVEGLKPHAPWVLLESSTFAGRYYFFNTTSLESKWSLPASHFVDRRTALRASMELNDDGDAHSAVNRSLIAANDAANRMDARYGASPSRPDSDFDPSTAFHKRERDLDPRLMSIDLEEKLRTALNKAETLERQWSAVTIPEVEETPEGGGKGGGGGDGKAPSDVLPSAESFQAMRDFASEGAVEDADSSELYSVLNGLGSGGYSNVLLARQTQRQDLVAMKVLSKKLLKRPQDRARLKNELRALTEIPPSPFIQRCFAAFESPSHVCFVTE